MAAPLLNTYFTTFTTDSHGQVFLSGILDVKAYATVNIEITQSTTSVPNLQVLVLMGKLSGTTVGQEIGRFPPSAQIHSFPVVGPELNVIVVGGPPNTVVAMEGWIFIH